MASTDFVNYYNLLGIAEKEARATARAKIKAALTLNHPDKHAATEKETYTEKSAILSVGFSIFNDESALKKWRRDHFDAIWRWFRCPAAKSHTPAAEFVPAEYLNWLEEGVAWYELKNISAWKAAQREEAIKLEACQQKGTSVVGEMLQEAKGDHKGGDWWDPIVKNRANQHIPTQSKNAGSRKAPTESQQTKKRYEHTTTRKTSQKGPKTSSENLRSPLADMIDKVVGGDWWDASIKNRAKQRVPAQSRSAEPKTPEIPKTPTGSRQTEPCYEYASTRKTNQQDSKYQPTYIVVEDDDHEAGGPASRTRSKTQKARARPYFSKDAAASNTTSFPHDTSTRKRKLNDEDLDSGAATFLAKRVSRPY